MLSVPTPAVAEEKPYQVARPASDALLDRAIALLVFVGCLSYLCIFLRFSSLEPDEGIVLQGATRVLAGQVPYRDFFSFYTPGSFYLVAGLFRVFGNSFAVARTSLAVAGALCSMITYLLARRVCSRWISVLSAVLAAAVGTAFRFLVLHNYYSTLFACLAVLAAVRFFERRTSGWAFAVSSCTALTFLVEQSKGGCLGLGLLTGFLLLRKFLGRLPLRAFAAGLIWPFLITFAYFAAHHATVQMVSDW